MKYRRIIDAAAVILIVSVFLNLQAYAAVDTALQKSCAAVLASLDLLHGDARGNLKLSNKMKRSEFITLVNSSMSYDVKSDAGTVKIKYKDITSKHWAYNDIMAAAAHGIIKAYGDNTIRPDKYVIDSEALEIVLKALGYLNSDSEADPAEILEKASGTGLSKNCVLAPDKQLTRGEAAILIYNALTIDFANT